MGNTLIGNTLIGRVIHQLTNWLIGLYLFSIFKKIFTFIYLVAPGFNCSLWNLVP